MRRMNSHRSIQPFIHVSFSHICVCTLRGAVHVRAFLIAASAPPYRKYAYRSRNTHFFMQSPELACTPRSGQISKHEFHCFSLSLSILFCCCIRYTKLSYRFDLLVLNGWSDANDRKNVQKCLNRIFSARNACHVNRKVICLLSMQRIEVKLGLFYFFFLLSKLNYVTSDSIYVALRGSQRDDVWFKSIEFNVDRYLRYTCAHHHTPQPGSLARQCVRI